MQGTFPKSVERVIVVKSAPDDGGPSSTLVIHRGTRGRKKQSRALRPLERLTRRSLKAQASAAQSLLARHERANRKKKNGWIRELPGNARKAGRRYFRILFDND